MAQVPATDNVYTGDGTTSQFAITFEYLKQDDVFVSINGESAPFSWATDSLVNINPAPVVGAEVRVYRNTPANSVEYIFNDGVPFLTRYADFNWKKLLFAFQESWAEFYSNARNYFRSLRTPEDINALPSASERAGKVVSFDEAGQPLMLEISSDSVPGIDYRVSIIEAFLVGIYNIFPRKVATWADIANTPVVGAGQLFTLTQHTSGGIGGGTLMAFAGSVTDDGGTQKNSETAGFYLKRIDYELPTIEMFGGGIGGNDQSALSALYNTHNAVALGPKDYLIDNLNIRKPFTIKTCGFKSRLIQNTGVTGTNQQISVITVAASDVSIGDIALIGTISTDTGEDRHGIRVDASTVPGGISNIQIGNINASNMRGDAIVLTGSAGRDVKNFSIGNVNGFNIFRNGVSVVSGIGGKIGVVTVAQEGLFAFDSEPDTSGGIVEDIFVAGVRGRHCGIPAVGSVQKGVVFGFVDLDWSLPQSTPPFTPIQDSEQHGLVLRSTNGCHIEYCILKGFPESPIRVFKEVSDDYVDNISFGTLIIQNCLTNSSNPPCLIRAAGSKNISVRGTLKYICTDPSLHELILDGSATGLVRLSANRIEGNAPIGRYVSVDCQSSDISYTQDRPCLIFLGNCTLSNSKWDVGIISASSSGLLTFISSDLKWSGSFKYADGIGTNFHTYELNSKASATAGAATTWAATRVDS